ncbi:MAG TPA: hypothetical protein VNA13_00010 [Xanthomonadales bacterium]|nr:hypothetical protein [Xanthomonadales bacterium]
MGYLERNATIISEINAKTASGEVILRGPKAEVTARGNMAIFSPIGHVPSDVLGSDLHLGVKRYHRRGSEFGNDQYRDALVSDLARVSGIADKIPSLTREVPVVFGLIATRDGSVVGILVEDFSRGGSVNVTSVSEMSGRQLGVIPYELRELIPGLDEEDLANAIFLVGDEQERRLGDFNQLLYRMSNRQRREIFPNEEIRERVEEFTVFVAGESI